MEWAADLSLSPSPFEQSCGGGGGARDKENQERETVRRKSSVAWVF